MSSRKKKQKASLLAHSQLLSAEEETKKRKSDDFLGKVEDNLNEGEENLNEREEFNKSPASSESSKNGLFLRHNLYSNRDIGNCDDETSSDDFSKRHLIGVEGESLTEKYLSADIFTMLYLCKNNTHVTIFCIIIALFQFTIIILLIISATNRGTDNVFGIPPQITEVVRFCQFFAILLMVASQDDFVNAIAYFSDGYSPLILEKAPHASLFKYYLCGLLKLVEGGLSLFITFVLIVQGDQVLGIFLNFAALSFVYSIDDVFFCLAGNFFFTDELGVLVGQIRTLKVPIPTRYPSSENNISSYRLVHIVYICTFVIVGWLILVVKQYEGAFSCESITVQFGDESFFTFGSFSGAYDRIGLMGEQKDRVGNRFIYLRRTYKDAIFAYCKNEMAWTFTSVSEEGENYLNIDPCDYDAKSAETKTYNIEETGNTKWFTWNAVSLQISEFDFFSLRCPDQCTDCNGVGNCNDNVCTCTPGNYGLNCEFKGDILCKELSQSKRKEASFGHVSTPFQIASEFNNSSISFHERPVYYRNIFEKKNLFKNRTQSDIILFIGRRWAFYRIEITEGSDPLAKVIEILEGYSSTHTSSIGHEYGPKYFSGEVTFGARSDKGSPIEIPWYGAVLIGNGPNSTVYQIDKRSPVDAELLCVKCNSLTNPCHNKGICDQKDLDTFGVCECESKYIGNLCEADDPSIPDWW
uniref:EGF-like domain-containing protein n=1 Tax=Eucampia antarctica TaxID=49252 RepID=A0A7S2WJ22_9STRA|mmetsp:Transcript_3730/g.3511  ORF Transcript_3730/g.3511 Transcript_3730/m.3511 type:complete len:695 (+) Transcript_3730:99-2183(+)